ncbi:MAG: hypothetical protein N3G48_05545 [Sulfolobales archaeon]|nr:hypothetical protein [Sulfolobales archaeon]
MSVTERSDLGVVALSKMRQGLLLILIGWLLFGLSLMIVFAGVFTAIGAWAVSPPRILIHYLVSWFVVGLITLIAGGLLSLIGFYFRFIPGVGELSSTNPEYSTPSKLLKVGYVGGLASVLAGAVLIPLISWMGFGLLILGLMLMILGHIGMVVLCLRLNNVEGDSTYLISGILFIVGIFIPILIVVSVILLYVALGDSVRKRVAAQKPVTT